ncbi:unnamed protein product, partial [Sphagnum compactum]
ADYFLVLINNTNIKHNNEGKRRKRKNEGINKRKDTLIKKAYKLGDLDGINQEQVATRDLGESLKTVHDATQRDIELTSVLKGELDTAKAENKALLQQGKAAITELTAELNTIKAEAKTLRKEAERVPKAEVDKRLETSKSQVTGLEKDLEAARQSIKEKERELASLKLEIDNKDERIRLLKAQLFKTNRLIQLEKEKEKLEAEQKEIQATLARAR